MRTGNECYHSMRKEATQRENTYPCNSAIANSRPKSVTKIPEA
jgi:hypothetical protein